MHPIRWVNERLNLGVMANAFLDRPVPGNVGWLNTLGSATLFLIMVQMVTGIGLTLFYVPSSTAAYASVQHIDSVAFGAFVRGVHHWSASVLVLLIGLHTLRVFFQAAYKYPREMTWLIGAVLFVVMLAFAFTGYLLPWDQKAYWATVVGTNVAGSAPIVGDLALQLMRGGAALSTVTLTRFYGIHVWVLPALVMLGVAIHLFMVIRQGIAAAPRRKAIVEEIPGESRRDRYAREYGAEKRGGHPFYQSLLKDAIVAAIIMAVIVVLAIVVGAPLEGQANPNSVGYVPRPEWYFLDMFQMLWYVSGPAEPLIIFLAGTVGFLLFLLLPFLDRGRERHPRRRPFMTAIGVVVVLGVVALTVQGAMAPVTSTDTTVEVDTANLSEAQVAGLKIYQVEGCTSCHLIAGHGGTAGPELTHVASKLDPAAIEEQILKPRNKMPPYSDITPEDMSKLKDFLSTLK